MSSPFVRQPSARPRRRAALLLCGLVLVAGSAGVAWAWSVCVDQYNASGCLMSSGCDDYDDATGAYRGGVRVNYHCPISY